MAWVASGWNSCARRATDRRPLPRGRRFAFSPVNLVTKRPTETLLRVRTALLRNAPRGRGRRPCVGSASVCVSQTWSTPRLNLDVVLGHLHDQVLPHDVLLRPLVAERLTRRPHRPRLVPEDGDGVP